MAQLVFTFLVTSYAAHVLAQIFLVRFTKTVMTAFFISWLLGLIILIGLFSIKMAQNLEFSRMLGYGVLALFSYMSLSFCFWAFLNLNLTSIRVRIFRELIGKHPSAMQIDQLTHRYDEADVVRKRVDRLIKRGHLKKKGNRLFVKRGELLALSISIRFLRRLIIPTMFK